MNSHAQGQATRILPTALHQKAKPKNSPSFPKKPKGHDIPPEEVQFLEDALRSGTLKGILKLYSNHTQDKCHIDYFVMAVGNFSDPEKLLQAMRDVLLETDDSKKRMVESRIANIFKRWNAVCNGQSKSYKPRVQHEMSEFRAFLVALNPSLSSYFGDQSNTQSGSVDGDNLEPEVIPPPKVPSSPDILSFSPLEIARQFTLIVSGQFKQLKISEFHLLRFLNSETSPTIGAIIHYSNIMINMLTQLILNSEANSQPILVKKLINIGKNLMLLQNYHSLMWIFLTLNSPSVAALTRSFKLVGYGYSKKVPIKEKIDTTLSPHMDYIGYRQLLDLGSPNIIPCLEISILDLSDLLKEENFFDSSGLYDHINIEKMNKIGKIISFIVRVQENEPKLQEEPVIRGFFLKAVPMDVQDDKREPIKIADTIRKKIKANEATTSPNGSPQPTITHSSSTKLTSEGSKSLKSSSPRNGRGTSSKTVTGKNSFLVMMVQPPSSLERKTFENFLLRSYEYDYFLLYLLLLQHEAGEDKSKDKLSEKILVDYLGFDGGDKRVSLPPDIIKTLFYIRRDEPVPPQAFDSVKAEILSMLKIRFTACFKGAEKRKGLDESNRKNSVNPSRV